MPGHALPSSLTCRSSCPCSRKWRISRPAISWIYRFLISYSESRIFDKYFEQLFHREYNPEKVQALSDLYKEVYKNWGNDNPLGLNEALIALNPDIANVFYRAGYIETWGQGIQKICDECTALGAELPKYEIIGTGLRVYFPALKSALIDQGKVPKDHTDTLDDTLADKIIALLKEDPSMKQEILAERTKVSIASVKRTMKILSDTKRIVRKGGKRYGYWEVR